MNINDKPDFLDLYKEFLEAETMLVKDYERSGAESNFLSLIETGAKVFAFNRAVKVYIANKPGEDFLKMSGKDDLIEGMRTEGYHSQQEVNDIVDKAKTIRTSSKYNGYFQRQVSDSFARLYLRHLKPISGESFAEETKNYLIGSCIINDSLNVGDMKELGYSMFLEVLKITEKTTFIIGEDLKRILDLERYIEAIEEYGKNIGISETVSLIKLRKGSFPRKNALCHQCGSIGLARKSLQSRCKRRESLSCYKSRIKPNKKEEKKMEALLRSNGKCSNCHQETSNIGHIHTVKDVSYRFCSSKCFVSFRKRKQRERMKG